MILIANFSNRLLVLWQVTIKSAGLNPNANVFQSKTPSTTTTQDNIPAPGTWEESLDNESASPTTTGEGKNEPATSTTGDGENEPTTYSSADGNNQNVLSF